MELVKVKEEVIDEIWEEVKFGDDLVTNKSQEVVPKLCFEEIYIKEELEENPDEIIKEAKNEIEKKYNFHLAGNCKNEQSEVSNGIGPTSLQKLQIPTLKKSSSCVKPFECNICPYKSSCKGNLVKHVMRNHTGENLSECTICHFKSASKGSLVIHMRIHTGEKPFECTICKLKYVRKGHLVSHMRIHSGEKPFKCTICNFKCAHKENLTRHLSIHTGEKPFHCKICNYKCALKANLTRHIRIHR